MNITPLYPAESNAQLAFDTSANATVIYASDCCDARPTSTQFTWEYGNGSLRRVLTNSTPDVGNNFFSLVADPAAGGVLLLGGYNQNGTTVNQTWLFQAGNWSNLNPTNSPPMLYNPIVGYDPLIRGVVLYAQLTLNVTANSSGNPLNETWQFSNGTWTETWNSSTIGLDNPGAMAYDPVLGRFLAVSSNATGPVSLWTYANSSWSPLTTGGSVPTNASYGSLDYDPQLSEVLYLASQNLSSYGSTNATWALNGTNWTRLNGSVLPGYITFLGTVTEDPADGSVLAYDGPGLYTPSVPGGDDTLWLLNGTQWIPAPGSIETPSYRCCFSGAYDAHEGYYVEFGGAVATFSTTKTYQATWTYSQGRWTNISKPGAPAGRYFAEMAYDPAANESVLFGGENPSSYLGDTWVLSNGNWTRLHPSTSPPAAGQGCMTYDSEDGYILYYGGYNGTNLNQTWKFSSGNWTVVRTNATPPEGTWCSMADDPLDQYVVLAANNATWTYHAGTWTNLSLSYAPAWRRLPFMAFDPRLGGVVLYAGGYGPSFGDLWLFRAGAWTRLLVGTNPNAIGYGAAAYDPQLGGLLVDVGIGWDSYVSQLWLIGGSLNFTVGTTQVSPGTIDLTQTAQLLATPSGGGGLYTYNWTDLPPGCSSANVSLLSCTPTAPGLWPVNVSVTNATGVVRHAPTAYVSVNPKLSVGPLTASPTEFVVGTKGTLSVTSSGGSAPVGFVWAGLPPGCTTADQENLTCDPTASGTFHVSANATDSADSRVSAQLTLTVAGKLRVTSVTPSSPALDLGEWDNITAFTSGGVAPLTFAWSGLPAGCLSENVSVLPCRPNATGSYLVSVNVSDANGNLASESGVSLIVHADLGPPSLTLREAVLDKGQSLFGNATAMGGVGPFRFNWTGLPPGCTAPTGPALDCTPEQTGAFHVSVLVRDSTGAASARTVANLTVFADPTISPVTLSAGLVDVGQVLGASVLVSVANNESANITWVGLPPGCVGGSVGTTNLTCRPAQTGLYVVHAVETDRQGGRASSPVTVIDVQAAPTISPLRFEPATIDLGQPVEISLSAVGASTLEIHWLGLPDGCAAALETEQTLSCTPTRSGTYTVSAVAVDDANDSAATPNASLVVSPPLSVGAPIAAPSSPVANASFLVTVAVTGGSGIVRWHWTGLPPGCSATAAGWNQTCNLASAGNWTLALTVTDANGVSRTSASLALEVFPASSASKTVPPSQGSGGGPPSGGDLFGVTGLGTIGVVVALAAVGAGAAVSLWRRRRHPPDSGRDDSPPGSSE